MNTWVTQILQGSYAYISITEYLLFLLFLLLIIFILNIITKISLFKQRIRKLMIIYVKVDYLHIKVKIARI